MGIYMRMLFLKKDEIFPKDYCTKGISWYLFTGKYSPRARFYLRKEGTAKADSYNRLEKLHQNEELYCFGNLTPESEMKKYIPE